MSNWKNRPVYEKITPEVISEVSDDLLAWAMFDHILFIAGKDYYKVLQVLAGLPLGFKVVYYLFALTGEIDNGGFNQYFFNGLDSDVEQHIEALRLVGACNHLIVLQEAFQIRDEEMHNEELQRRYKERTIEAFFSTYGLTKLEKCDREWYAMDNEFNALLAKFIRSNIELFVTKNDL